MTNTTGGVLAHLGGLLFGVFIPLLMYVFSDDEFTKHHAWQATKWQLAVTFGILASLVLLPFVMWLPAILLLLGLDSVLPVIGAIKASQGEKWSYPLLSDSDTQNQSSKPEKSRKEARIERLKQRYMNGELSDEEFERRLDDLLSSEEERTGRDATPSRSRSKRKQRQR